MFESHVSESAADGNELVEINKQAFTEVTSHLNKFWCSQDFKKYVCGLIKTTQFSSVQKSVAVEIGVQVFSTAFFNPCKL